MVGPPGSGKSTWVRMNVPMEYIRVSQDVLKSRERCLRYVRDAIARGDKVVVDNTNPVALVRGMYVDLARQASVPVRCIHIDTGKEMAEHLNAMREDHPNPSVRKARVPPVGETMFWSKRTYSAPIMAEGYTELIRIPFEYSEAETPRELYEQRHR